ncbi:glycosyltransferase family 87 protein [Nubsella zeaxanthinifaciens]|uniref:glycosyltransferase family 87 protein n=1 Tax=Nubsella zeaxanthinifaciens TaxID=392412 RepID=UPI000DE21E62|nr:glycosyltransferase family 87 protein [Nubsella zeaxanthinifaciens]
MNTILKTLNNRKFILGIWLLLAIFLGFKQYHKGSYNNYLIFKHVYHHAVERLNLYAEYPQQYGDTNHYGPFFSLLIAPFALLPDYIGTILWQIANTLFLFFAIQQLPLAFKKINAVYWIVAHELMTALFSFQFNISIAAIIILTFAFIQRGKNFWAAMLIMLGTFVKLYGIVGLAFFFFVKKKWNFVLSCFCWALIFFILPMVFFSPTYILQCYQDWYRSLAQKQQLNASLTSMQDISVMGMARRISGDVNLPNLPFLAGGLLLFALPYLRIKAYADLNFRLLLLASTLIFTVIFSNSSESPTYIIAFLGVSIWFLIQQRPFKIWQIALFVFALLLTSFSPSDLFPKFVRENYIKPYSLKALPCLIVWLVIIYQMMCSKFNQTEQLHAE